MFRLAVRSSGVSEDGKDQSSAGQNETFLGVTGKQNILHKILKNRLFERILKILSRFHANPLIWGPVDGNFLKVKKHGPSIWASSPFTLFW